MFDLVSKKDYQDLLISIVRPLFDLIDDKRTSFTLKGMTPKYDDGAVAMEEFARPLWGLVPFWIGGGEEKDIEKFYREGIALGCDPEYEGFWGYGTNGDQRYVEMAPIAFALISLPEKFWQPLSNREKNNVYLFLNAINEHNIPQCNWVFFRILVNTAFKCLGLKYDQSILDADWAYIESNYVRGGWFIDGQSGRVDYYSAFAMQYYSLLLDWMGKNPYSEVKQRAREFSKDFIKWFASDGAALPYGRSLTYRFAQCGFFSVSLLDDAVAFTPGVIKGVINRNLRYFLEKDIFTERNVLSVGYGYFNPFMMEKYNAPGSPNWALKAFAFLALPDDSPFWNAKEEELPTFDLINPMEEAYMIVQHRGFEAVAYPSGHLRMVNLGHFQQKYYKFAYSTLFPFSVPISEDTIENAAPDSVLSFVVDGRFVFTKNVSDEYEIKDGRIRHKWSPIRGITVESEIIPTEYGHVRKHVINSEIDCVAYDCGFAIEPGEVVVDSNKAEVQAGGYYSAIESDTPNAKLDVIKTMANTNILHRRTLLPAVVLEIKKGTTTLESRIKTGKCK